MIKSFSMEYRFLSNFYPSKIIIENDVFPTAEHAYQSMKTLVESEKIKILMAPTPKEAKRAGRVVTLRNDWDNIKLFVMAKIVYEKFAQNKELKQKLLRTGKRELIEGNSWGDTYWGVCNGVGENYLGKLLMEIRQGFQNGNVR